MVGEGGVLLNLPARYHEPPYTLLPSEEEVSQIAGLIESVYDDAALYERLCACAWAVGRREHDMATNAARVHAALSGLLSFANPSEPSEQPGAG